MSAGSLASISPGVPSRRWVGRRHREPAAAPGDHLLRMFGQRGATAASGAPPVSVGDELDDPSAVRETHPPDAAPDDRCGHSSRKPPVGCWLKCHHPGEFLTAMLNSQPLGFYSASQLVQDARRHGVEVRPPDVMFSDYDCTLEDLPRAPAVRLGLRLVTGMKEAAALRIMAARAQAPFDGAEDLARRAELDQKDMRLLAGADALASLAGHRRQQVWEASALKRPPQLLRDAPVDEALLELPPALEGEEVVHDYATIGLTLRSHPLALLRPRLAERKLATAATLDGVGDGRFVRYAGIVTLRQQPETASGTIFMSLEDETGVVQVIVWRSLRERQRPEVLRAKLLEVHGTWQREGDVKNLIAGRLVDLTPLLGRLETSSRDFH